MLDKALEKASPMGILRMVKLFRDGLCQFFFSGPVGQLFGEGLS